MPPCSRSACCPPARRRTRRTCPARPPARCGRVRRSPGRPVRAAADRPGTAADDLLAALRPTRRTRSCSSRPSPPPCWRGGRRRGPGARPACQPGRILVLADADVKAGNWRAAEAQFASLPAQGATQVLQPLLRAWAQQGAGATDEALNTLRPFVEGTRYRGVFALHAAMINDQAGRTADAARLYRLAHGGIWRAEPAARHDRRQLAGPQRAGGRSPRHDPRHRAGEPGPVDRRAGAAAGGGAPQVATPPTGSPRPTWRWRRPCSGRMRASSRCCCCAWRWICGRTSRPPGCWRPRSRRRRPVGRRVGDAGAGAAERPADRRRAAAPGAVCRAAGPYGRGGAAARAAGGPVSQRPEPLALLAQMQRAEPLRGGGGHLWPGDRAAARSRPARLGAVLRAGHGLRPRA